MGSALGGNTGKEIQTGRTKQSGTQKTSGTSMTDVPEYLQPFIQNQIPGVAATSIQDLQRGVQNWQIPTESWDALRQTAGGEYLTGPHQQAYIDQAIRAGMSPTINAFSGRPAGGGLAQAAISQYGQDAFDRLYQFERTNQLNAAPQLAQLSMLPLELQRMLANTAGTSVGQFAPLYGSETTGKTKTSGASQSFAPEYEEGWLKPALAVGALAAAPFTGGMSAMAIPGLLGGGGVSQSNSGVGGTFGSGVFSQGGVAPYTGNPYGLPWLGQR